MRVELVHVSVMIAAAASITNRIARAARPMPLLHDLPTYLPVHSHYFVRALETLLEDPMDLETCHAFQDYSARLALATSLSRHIAPRLKTIEAGWHRQAQNCADAWQRVAMAALKLHGRLSEILPSGEPSVIASTEHWVLEALKSASDGGTPCIDHAGDICLPGWVEQRCERRIPVEVRARLSGLGQDRACVIIDVSMRGLGLLGEAIAGRSATVVLDDGRRLGGSIEWARSGRFGMFLDQSLLPSDPLLAIKA
jgi:hypothetical protein